MRTQSRQATFLLAVALALGTGSAGADAASYGQHGIGTRSPLGHYNGAYFYDTPPDYSALPLSAYGYPPPMFNYYAPPLYGWYPPPRSQRCSGYRYRRDEPCPDVRYRRPYEEPYR